LEQLYRYTEKTNSNKLLGFRLHAKTKEGYDR